MNFWKSFLEIPVFLFGVLGLFVSLLIFTSMGGVDGRININIFGLIILIGSISACVYPFLPDKPSTQIPQKEEIVPSKHSVAFGEESKTSVNKAKVISLVLVLAAICCVILFIWALIGLSTHAH